MLLALSFYSVNETRHDSLLSFKFWMKNILIHTVNSILSLVWLRFYIYWWRVDETWSVRLLIVEIRHQSEWALFLRVFQLQSTHHIIELIQSLLLGFICLLLIQDKLLLLLYPLFKWLDLICELLILFLLNSVVINYRLWLTFIQTIVSWQAYHSMRAQILSTRAVYRLHGLIVLIHKGRCSVFNCP